MTLHLRSEHYEFVGTKIEPIEFQVAYREDCCVDPKAEGEHRENSEYRARNLSVAPQGRGFCFEVLLIAQRMNGVYLRCPKRRHIGGDNGDNRDEYRNADEHRKRVYGEAFVENSPQ